MARFLLKLVVYMRSRRLRGAVGWQGTENLLGERRVSLGRKMLNAWRKVITVKVMGRKEGV